MAKLTLIAAQKIYGNVSGLAHVQLPDSGFSVKITVDKTLETLVKDPKSRKALETVTKNIYKKFVQQTTKRLQKFEKLFAGMLAKGAAPAAVAKQAEALKTALEKDIPKWEKAAERAAMDQLKKQAKKKR